MAAKAFSVFLQDLRDGRVHAELTAQLEQLLGKVKETGKGGSITLKIKVKPAGRGADVDKVVLSDVVTVDLPESDRGEDFYWLTDSNELSRNHPRQGHLDLREAPLSQPTTLKEAQQ